MDNRGGEFGTMIAMTMTAVQPHETPQPHRFTREEYHQMAELGFFRNRRVELIDGEIIDIAAMKDLHAVGMGVAAATLQQAFPECWVRHQLPLSFTMDSEPEPDLVVVPGQPRNYMGKGHPSDAIVVVELSDTTLRFDRGRKASLYARAGIKDYWIVNLNGKCLEVMREPVEEAGAPLGWKYGSVVTLRGGESVSPLAKPEVRIAVSDLLP